MASLVEIQSASPPAPPQPEDGPSDLKQLLKSLGPGLITGASDDDPSGIGTYAVAGASLGYATLWTALASFPMMTAVQYTCAKIGMVSGTGLAGVLRERFPRPLLYAAVFALVMANSVNAGADIGAIAAAINLLVPIPLVMLIVPIGMTILALQILGSYEVITRCFKWLTAGLLAYIGASLFARPDWGDVLRGTFLPTLSLDPGYISTLVAIFGTTISPYMFFWQPSQEVEEEIENGRVTLAQRRGASSSELRAAAADTRIGMLFSFLGINPIDALFWTAVLNGFLAPPLLVLVMLVANTRDVMGSRTNGPWLNLLGWGTTVVMFAAAIGLVVTWGR